MKTVRSWSQPERDAYLIGRKQVDWSFLRQGTVIPHEFIEDFDAANDGIHLNRGDRRKVTLLVDSRVFEAVLENVDRQVASDTYRISWTGSPDFRALLTRTFSYSLKHLDEVRASREDGSGNVTVPEDKAEFVEFYKTEQPFQYRVNLIPRIAGELKGFKDLLTKVLEGYPEARNQHFSGSSEMAGILTREIPQTVSSTGVLSSERYKVRGSAGQGNWASVPWVAIMDGNITETTQSGVYLVYLFSSDMQSIYLSFMQGVTNVVREQPGAAGYELLAQRAAKLRDQLDIGDLQWENPQLGNVSLARQYEAGIIAYIKYDKGKLPDDEKLYADLSRMLDLYSQYRGSINVRTDDADPEIREVRTDYEILGPRGILGRISQYVTAQGFQYSYSDLCNFYLSLRTKPFVILAGISGTGKSQLPRLFARAISANTEPIAVRPDWNDGSDLLGYSDLEGRFRPGALTKLIERANEDSETPMLVVLDEMNLARVEHYMSDLLSVMETRTITEDGTYTTKSLFGNTEFKDEADAERFGSLTLPDNLYIIGTVNMDETTHPFSKKVLDRANTIEFSDVDLTGYRSQTVEQVEPTVLTNEQLRGKCIHLSHALAEDSEYIDGVVDKLADVNKVLSQANLHIGYRVRDEVAIYMLYNHRLGLLDEDVAFDYQLMQKILPRLQGSSQPIRRVLVQLLRICGGVDLSNTNDDLLSKLQEFEARGKAKPYPRSTAKLVSMLRRFEEDGFTSYWI